MKTKQERIEAVARAFHREVERQIIAIGGETLSFDDLNKDSVEYTFLIDGIKAAIAAYEESLPSVENDPFKSGAFENLQQYQGQLDEDGVCVAVSRQALDEVMQYAQQLNKTIRGEDE